MKQTKPVLDRLTSLKRFENELSAMIKTREEKPANAFRYAIEQTENDVDIEELSDLKFEVQKLIDHIESTFSE